MKAKKSMQLSTDKKIFSSKYKLLIFLDLEIEKQRTIIPGFNFYWCSVETDVTLDIRFDFSH